MKQYAYIRVSSKDQNIDRQLSAIESFHIPKKQVFCDHQSGKDFDRPAYKRMLRRLKQGDLVIIKSIDRLGRNYDEILEQWALITKRIGADILVLDMSLLDTRERGGDLTGAFIADLVLQILAYVAQTEREFIHQRQAEGIAAAKAKGVRFGRRPDVLPAHFEEICQQYANGQLSVRNAATLLGMSKSSFHRKYKRFMQAATQKPPTCHEGSSSEGSLHRETATISETDKTLSEKTISEGRLCGTSR